MKELSLIEKFTILFDNILEHPLFIMLLVVPIILFFLQKKHGRKVYIIVYFISIISILIIGGNDIFKLFDNFMDGFFMVLYFPNFITLFIVVLLNALFAFVSLFSKSMHKLNKVINYLFFGLVQSLFALVLITVRSNKINIYKDNALYSNSDVLSLMQILIGFFTLQAIILFVLNLVNRVTAILDRKEKSDSINDQISTLKKSKYPIKQFDVDNEKIGYINVADKKVSSRPILKPFKFNINKIESIRVDTKPKAFTYINLKNTNASYLNEIIKPRRFKPIRLDSNKIVLLRVYDNNMGIKKIILNTTNVSYLNEIIKYRKFRTLKLDSSKFVYLTVSDNQAKLFNKINLNGKNFTYLNEIVKDYSLKGLDSHKYAYLDVDKPYTFKNINGDFTYVNDNIKHKKYSIFKLDSNKYLNLNVSKQETRNIRPHRLNMDKINNIELKAEEVSKPFSRFSLKNKAISYLNEIVKIKKFKPFELDSGKISSIKFSEKLEKARKKLYNTFKLDNSKSIYMDSKKLVKPDLMKPMSNFKVTYNKEKSIETDKSIKSRVNTIKSSIYTPVRKEESISISNLKIIDVQSTLDAVSKYNLMKRAKLKSYNEKIVVDNLIISNFSLLIRILKKYRICKTRK